MKISPFKAGDLVVVHKKRFINVFGKYWPVINRRYAIVIAVEPQGILLNDGLYYSADELKPF